MFLPRTRNRSAQAPTNRVAYYHKATAAEGWPTTPTTYSQQNYSGETGSISDCPHPGYRRSINRGKLVLGDLVISQSKRSQQDANCTYGPYGKPDPLGWGYEKLVGDVAAWVEGRVSDYSSPSSDMSTMANVALVQAYAKANESPLLTGEFLSDFGKTISMLKRPLGSSLNLLNSMVRYRNKRLGKTVASATKASAHAWLEYRYGWKPILLDCETAIREASDFSTNLRSRRLVARGSVPFDRSVSNVQQVTGGLPRLSGADVAGTYRSSGGAFAGVIYEVKASTTSEQLLKILGLRPSDLPATAWEIIPFSFVADWFTNTGEWLRAVTPNPGINILGSWKTTVLRRQRDLTLSGFVTLGPSTPYPAVTFSNLPCGSSSITTFEMTREINPAIQPPVFRGTSLTRPQTVDACALMVNQILSNLGRVRH